MKVVCEYPLQRAEIVIQLDRGIVAKLDVAGFSRVRVAVENDVAAKDGRRARTDEQCAVRVAAEQFGVRHGKVNVVGENPLQRAEIVAQFNRRGVAQLDVAGFGGVRRAVKSDIAAEVLGRFGTDVQNAVRVVADDFRVGVRENKIGFDVGQHDRIRQVEAARDRDIAGDVRPGLVEAHDHGAVGGTQRQIGIFLA